MQDNQMRESRWDSISEAASSERCWYAIQARGRFEKKVAAQLENKGIENFLPLVKQVRRWSDRRKVVQVPLFPGYGFVRVIPARKIQLAVLQTAGVIGFVAFHGKPAPVPEKQIEDIQRLLAQDVSCSIHPFLRAGQRVRIRGGCLDGIEGILTRQNSDRSLVISIEAIQRSLAIRVDGYDVELI